MFLPPLESAVVNLNNNGMLSSLFRWKCSLVTHISIFADFLSVFVSLFTIQTHLVIKYNSTQYNVKKKKMIWIILSEKEKVKINKGVNSCSLNLYYEREINMSITRITVINRRFLCLCFADGHCCLL